MGRSPYLRKALNIFRSIGELEGQATTLNNLSNVYYDKHNLTKSMQYAKASLDINVKIGNRHGEALSLANIGSTYGAKGDLNKALQYYGSAEVIFDEIGEEVNLARVKRDISLLKFHANLNC